MMRRELVSEVVSFENCKVGKRVFQVTIFIAFVEMGKSEMWYVKVLYGEVFGELENLCVYGFRYPFTT